jgi:hypothetical protein
MKKFDIARVNKKEKNITAGSGTTLFQLSELAEKANLLFPHEITTQQSATIGGAISTNSFGYRSGKFRSLRNLILGIEAVLPTGEIIKTKPLFKTSTGYDLASLLIGSEGTLGITTEVTLRLFSKPESREFSTYLFNSFDDGFKAGEKIWEDFDPDFFALGELGFLRYSQTPVTFFIKTSDSKVISNYLHSKYSKSSLSGKILGKIFSIIPQTRQMFRYVDNSVSKISCLSVLTVGFEGENKIVKIKRDKTASLAKKFGGIEFNDESFYRERFKSFAKLKEIIIDHFPDHSQNFNLVTFDLSIPKNQVIRMKEVLNQLLGKYKSIYMLYSELYSSISTLGLDLIVADKNNEEYFNFLDELANKTTELGGSLSFAHGIGTRFLPYLEKDLGENYLNFMRKIKSALDPLDILNPGKMGGA